MRHNVPIAFSKVLRKFAFQEVVRNVLGYTPSASLDVLWAIVSGAAKHGLGANILITPCASAEAERLSFHSTLVSPFLLTERLAENLSKTDGTMIVDKHGICYTIGAILDGEGNVYGDWRRGGRFNSAVMYVHASKVNCIVVVISQEGFVDLVYKNRGMKEQGLNTSFLHIEDNH